MTKRSKSVYIFGSMLIGIVTVLAVLLTLVGTGVIDTSSRDLVFTSASAEAAYDGTELTASGWKLTSGELKSGHTAKVTVTGKQLNVGVSDNHISVAIVDAQGADVSEGYNIKCIAGKLAVTARYYEIKSASDEKVYDGLPLTAQNYSVVSGDLPQGHDISVAYTGTITNAGTAQNTITARIRNSKNVDVTGNFNLVCTAGQLQVKQLAITFKSSDAEKEYDGSPLTNNAAAVATGELCRGHVVDYEFTGSTINAGTANNTFTAVISNDKGENVTANYDVKYVFGTLSVSRHAITVATDDNSKVYDGTPLIDDKWRVVTDRETGLWHASGESQSLIGTDKIVVNVFGTRTDVGTEENRFVVYSITDSLGNNAALNYAVTNAVGALTVTSRPLTVQSIEASKNYDGLPLTNNNYVISSDTKLAAGHNIAVVISGERTEAGESPNTIAEVIITSGGRDVTANYAITLVEGALVVKGKSGTSFGNPPPPDAVNLQLLSDYKETVYLRSQSYGDYMGSEFLNAPEYDGGLDGKSCNYLASYSLENSGLVKRKLDIRLITAPFVVPYYAAPEGEYVQASDVTYSGTAMQYSIDRYAYDCKTNNAASFGPLGRYIAEERAYRQFVYENYLYVPDGTKAYMQSVITKKGFAGMGKRAVLKAVADYLQDTATAVYNLDYDKALDGESDVVVAFLTKYKEGICQHYAMSGTMLLRTLGIPARYTVGYMGVTQPSVWTDIKVGHAWVEAYIDGVGWTFVEVTGGAQDGNPADPDDGKDPDQTEPPQGGSKYAIKPVECVKQYDGSPLNAGTRVQGIAKLIDAGYRYEAVLRGSQTEVGYGTSSVQTFSLYDKDNVLVYQYENGAQKMNSSGYTFSFETGRLHVYKYHISIKTASATKPYDGEPLKKEEFSLMGTKLESGHKFGTVTMGSQLDAGKSINGFSAPILDSAGNDVTAEYKIDFEFGTLEVTPIALKIVTGTATATVAQLGTMGGKLTCNMYDILDSSGNAIATGLSGSYTLDCGIVITVEISGAQSRRGRSDNSISKITVTDLSGNEAEHNVSVTREYGRLTVTA